MTDYRYSVSMQVICDVDKRIISMHVGCPGSCADSSVFRRMGVYKYSIRHFSPGEYLLADSAYGLSNFCIPPYKVPAANIPANVAFNYCLAKSCVRNEHCIVILKGRWASLRELRQPLRDKNDMQILVNWVIACCVLHNMLAQIGDFWDEEYKEKEVAEIHDEYVDEVNATSAVTIRETLKKTTIETNIARGVLKE